MSAVGKSLLWSICLHEAAICHPSNYTACSFSKCNDLKGSAVLFPVVAFVFRGTAATIYALSSNFTP